MPVQVYWGNEEKQYIVWKVEGTLTKDEMIAALKPLGEHIEAAGKQVPILSDMLDMTHMPHDAMNTMKEIMTHPDNPNDPESGVVFVVARDDLVFDGQEIFSALEHPRALFSRLYRTREQAIAALQRYLKGEDDQAEV